MSNTPTLWNLVSLGRGLIILGFGAGRGDSDLGQVGRGGNEGRGCDHDRAHPDSLRVGCEVREHRDGPGVGARGILAARLPGGTMSQLLLLGLLLIAVGVCMVAVGTVSQAAPSVGGFVLVGPVPIVFGTGS